MPTELERRFNDELFNIYKRAKAEVGYPAARFVNMVTEQGGLEAARTLMHASKVSDGYVALWQLGRLDLTVETVLREPMWAELFSETEREIARKRRPSFIL